MDDYGKGASRSLNRTIAELQRFLGGSAGRYRVSGSGLRAVLDGLHHDLSRRAFELGYKAAHDQLTRYVEEHGEFPGEIAYAGQPRLAPNDNHHFSIRSKVTQTKFFKVRHFNRDVWFWEALRKQL